MAEYYYDAPDPAYFYGGGGAPAVQAVYTPPRLRLPIPGNVFVWGIVLIVFALLVLWLARLALRSNGGCSKASQCTQFCAGANLPPGTACQASCEQGLCRTRPVAGPAGDPPASSASSSSSSSSSSSTAVSNQTKQSFQRANGALYQQVQQRTRGEDGLARVGGQTYRLDRSGALYNRDSQGQWWQKGTGPAWWLRERDGSVVRTHGGATTKRDPAGRLWHRTRAGAAWQSVEQRGYAVPYATPHAMDRDVELARRIARQLGYGSAATCREWADLYGNWVALAKPFDGGNGVLPSLIEHDVEEQRQRNASTGIWSNIAAHPSEASSQATGFSALQ